METDKIIEDLQKRFENPLPEFYDRRIIFWYDESREFEEQFEEIELQNVKNIKLSSTNNFEVKKLLGVDDITSNYLVYCPFIYDDPEDDWLMDIKLYSEEFRADMISIWMNEMNLPITVALRKQIKENRKFFNAKKRREKIAKQSKTPTLPGQLQMAVLGMLCGIKDVTSAKIIKEVLKQGLDKEQNAIYQEFVNYKVNKAFWNMIYQKTGYLQEEGKEELSQLAAHILLTATTRTLEVEYLEGLNSFISMVNQAYCYDFVSEWMHSKDYWKLYEIAKKIESEMKLPDRFMKLEIEELADTKCLPCIDEVILQKLMKDVIDYIIDVDKIRNILEKRRTGIWYADVKNFYEGMEQVANMKEFYKVHIEGFHLANADEVWNEYTTEYYKMDTYYRLFHRSYAESLKIYSPELPDLFYQVMKQMEGLYKNWFLEKLNDNWEHAAEEELLQFGRICGIAQQTDFYQSKIKNSDTRVFVIISDALRYEVAKTLAEELQRETRSEVSVSSMQGIFPTITKFGMAALLPHKELAIKSNGDQIKVLADDKYTDSNYRDQILKNANSKSVALKYKDIIARTRTYRNDLVKGQEVIYIYHDTIDEASHTADTAVFPACDTAIIELKNLVRMLVNDFSATNIKITADHGFLYTYEKLTEEQKFNKSVLENRMIEYGRRYAILMKGEEVQYLQKIQLFDEASEFDAYAPKGNVRIKLKGSGLNFVHGGTSLQEMVVPLIEYHHLRNDSKEYQKNKDKYDTKPAEIALLSGTHKVSNPIFSLSFYQKQAVGYNIEPALYHIYFTDSDEKIISDIPRIIADKTDVDTADRIFRCIFNLKSQKYDNKEVYYLVIADENGTIIQKEEFQIEITFGMDEYEFFD